MKTVILTSGPRAAGKSTFCDMVQKNHPEVAFFSRDKLLISLFGKTSLDCYSGGHQYALDVLFENIKKSLSAEGDQKMLLDCWNGYPSDRRHIIRRLKEAGADRIICWRFITPLETCIRWSSTKGDKQDWYSEDSCKNDFQIYHKYNFDLSEEGFDSVYNINPSQIFIPGFPIV